MRRTNLKNIAGGIDLAEFRKFANNVKPSDQQKYKLWLECGRISPYTGKIINLSQLFSGSIQVEHIIPYSRTMDNSFANKTLCEQDMNAAKGNLTPYEFFSRDPEQLKEFKKRIQRLPASKQDKMLAPDVPKEFSPNMLASTAYIAREARKVLRRVCKDVRVTDGQITSLLRRFWGLNNILDPNRENEKSRDDHRHHAIDAFVIANSDDYWINLINRAASFDAQGRMHLDKMREFPEGRALLEAAGIGVPMEPDPLGLQQHVNPLTGEILAGGMPGPYLDHRHNLENALSQILISYRNQKRLLSPKKNSYRYSKSTVRVQKVQKSISVRGPLHAEYIFGQIENPYTSKLEYVIRKPLECIHGCKATRSDC